MKRYYTEADDIALKAAPECCREHCKDEIIAHMEDQGKGPCNDYHPVPACPEWPEGVRPDDCSKNMVGITTEELSQWQRWAHESLSIINNYDNTVFKTRNIKTELLFDAIGTKIKSACKNKS